jgi:Fe-S-cluster-containing dehydrogenase component
MEEVVLPAMPTKLFPPIAEAAAASANTASRIGSGLLEFFAENRFFNGTAAMLIDLDQCTHCDDCVRACASTHNNNPRFVRHGPIHGPIMVAHACMHCADPVCMIGCPTGAIHRSTAGGEIVINQTTCIGCSICANNCPYDAIRMVEIRDDEGVFMVDKDLKPILKATKCDLCVDQYGGPACERACPHGALVRTDMSDMNTLAQWLDR